jgi:cytoskeletal protein RodZ
VSVGEALSKARSQAGLTVDQLSERTRIRNTVIRNIEQDDYDACGGDVFVRGYVRAIAGAVGIDARPLISEYNRTRADTSRDRDRDTHITHVARIADQVPPAADEADVAEHAVAPAAEVAEAAEVADPDATVADLPIVDVGLDGAADRPAAAVPPAADPDATRFDLPLVAEPVVSESFASEPFVSEDPTPTVSDLPVIPAEPPPPPMPWEPPPPPPPRAPAGTRSQPGRPGRARQPQRRESRSRGERRTARIAVPAVLVLAVAGVAIGFAASGGSTPAGQNAALTQPSSHAGGGALGTGKSAGKTSAPASPGASASPTASPTPTATSTPSPASVPVTSLPISSAQAFGPQGLSDGDNPQVAQSVVSGGSQGPWSSQWYATPQFGNLKQGTGLLIDMGHPVTITSVKIDLASYGGANLQLRVGDPAGGPSGMQVAARADDVGGTVRLHLQTPQYVRYLLIWFTLLPPNGNGQYQATVSHVVVNGRS